uniref:AAA+ ATPase domain-containing protein n=1 Tax=Trichomanes trollii TaxID=1481379 RepID=A0A410YEM3_9MONI|nr:conserved hypothetical protein Ycf2 [Trichomanes trollii]QAV57635.1 conserved hypothetical protein Ycf2 [Trichomanes trollii]
MNPLLLRDLRDLIKHDNRLILVILLAVTIPISVYNSSKTGLSIISGNARMSDLCPKRGTLSINNLVEIVEYASSKQLFVRKRLMNNLADNISLNTYLIQEPSKDSGFLGIKGILTLWEIKRYSQSSYSTKDPRSLLDKPSLLCLKGVFGVDSKNQAYNIQDLSKCNLFFHSLRLNSLRDLEGFLDLYSYSRIRYQSINQLTRLLSFISELKFISKRFSIDYLSKGSIRVVPIKMNNLSKIFSKDLKKRTSKDVTLRKIFPNLIRIIDIPGEITSRYKFPIFWSELKEKYNIYSLSSLLRLYEQDRIVSFYLIYFLFFYDCFYTVANSYIFQLENGSVSWEEGSRKYTDVTRSAIKEGFLGWKESIRVLVKKSLIIRIDESDDYTSIQSSVRRLLNLIRDSSLSSFEKVLLIIRYDFERSIYCISLVRNILLDRIGICLNNSNSDCSPRFTSLLYLYQIILSEIVSKGVLVDMVHASLYRLSRISFMLPDFLLDLLNIDEKISLFEGILQRKNSFLIESEKLMDDRLVGSSIRLEPPIYQNLVESYWKEDTQNQSLKNILSVTGRQDWNQFLDNVDSEIDLATERNKSQYDVFNSVDQPDFIDKTDSKISGYSQRYYLPIARRNYSDRICSNHYLNLLDYSCMNFENNKIMSFFVPKNLDNYRIISSIQFQVFDLLLSGLSQRIQESDNDYLFATNESDSLDSSKYALLKTKSLYDPNLDLASSSAELSSPFQDIKKLSRLLLTSRLNCLEEALRGCGTPSNGETRLYFQNMGFDRFFLEKSIDERLSSGNNPIDSQTSQNICSTVSLFFESGGPEVFYWLRRFLLQNSITPRFLAGRKVLYKNTRFEDRNTCIRDELPSHTFYVVTLNEVSRDLDRYTKNCWIFWGEAICQRWSLFTEYTSWFFTLTWWKYLFCLIMETYPEIVLRIRDQFELSYLILHEKVFDYTKNTIIYLSTYLKLLFRNDSINIILAKLDLSLFKEITNQSKIACSQWSIVRSLNRYSLSYPLLLILVVLLFIRHYLSVLLGLNFFHLWNHFHTVQYLIDPARGLYFEKVMYSPLTRQMQTKYLLVHSFKRLLNYINNIFFYLFVRNRLDYWIREEASSDTLRINSQLLTQCFVTNKTISRYVYGSKVFDYNLLRSDNVDESFLQEGFDFMSYLYQFCQNALLTYKTQKLDLAEKWVLSALEKSIVFSAIVKHEEISNISCCDIPISFQSGLLPFRGILLVGPNETGRSFLIKSLASSSSLPLVKIPVRKFVYNKSFFGNIRGRFISSSRQSVHRLNLFFAIAKELSPSIIWIEDIHELNINRLYHRLEANPEFLLCLLLKKISNAHSDSCSTNLVIALTHVPRKVDPAFLAPTRLNQLINLRRSTASQRQRYLSVLLRIKGFEIETKPSFLQGIDSVTMGYSKRDISFFANGILLISTSRKTQRIIYSDAIELALYRQNSFVTCIGNQESSLEIEILFYRMGKSFLKTSLLKIPFTDLSFMNVKLFKKRFYYLYNWFLEPFRTESTVKEFTVLPYVLFSLAGLAARDCWLKVDISDKEDLIIINKTEENDFNLACGILEVLSKDFFCSEINRSGSQTNSLSFSLLVNHNCSSNIDYCSYSTKLARKKSVSNSYKRSHITKNFRKRLLRDIAWSPKVWHLSIIRNYSFESIRLLSESNSLDNLFLFYKDQNQIPQRDFEFNKIRDSGEKPYKGKRDSFGYKRSLGNLRKREVKRLENQLDNILLRERFLGLGFSGLDNQYETQLEQSSESVVFLGKGFVWDPALPISRGYGILPPCHNLLANQELVRRLYITYGIRRKREKHFPNENVRFFFLYRGYDRKSLTELSIKRWDNYPLNEEHYLEYVNEIQSMFINLQYPQLFVPIHLYQSILVEDLQERFIRSNIMIHKKRWLDSNCFPSRYFLTYNMLLESYQYIVQLCQSDKMALSRVIERLEMKDSFV